MENGPAGAGPLHTGEKGVSLSLRLSIVRLTGEEERKLYSRNADCCEHRLPCEFFPHILAESVVCENSIENGLGYESEVHGAPPWCRVVLTLAYSSDIFVQYAMYTT